MLDGDLFAVRPGAVDDAQATSAPELGPAPEAVAVSAREPRLQRIRRVATSTGITVLCHCGLAMLFVAAWQSMIRDVSAPEAIPVEIVSAIPGEKPKPEPPPESKPPPTPEPPSPAPAPDPAPPQAPSAQSVLDEALKPVLLEPPPEPQAAAAQSAMNQNGNATPDKPAATVSQPAGTPDAPPSPPVPLKPPEAPRALTAASSETSVPMPAKAPDVVKPPSRGDPTATARDVVAQLTSALPMSTLPIPSTFRAALAAKGTATDGEYRGAVFGALARAQEAVQEEARDKRLEGQVVLAIVLTDTGAIAKVTVVQSSGRADSDDFAVAIVRKAAPFPPPPPGASRTFTPAVTFGAS